MLCYGLVLSSLHGDSTREPTMAASSGIQLPEKFNFSRTEDWPEWIHRFERYRQASELTKKDDTLQINTLIHAMGHQAEDILTSLKLTQDELKKYDTIKAKLDSYFVIRRNVIFERSEFNKRVQLENETVDSFVTDLHCMAEHCQFGDINDELIRDRLVIGLRDTRLAGRLQLDPELTLENAVNQARQPEAVKKQQVHLRDNQSSYGAKETVDAVHKSKFYRKKEQQKRKDQGHTVTPNATYQRCGKSPSHIRNSCPAKDLYAESALKKDTLLKYVTVKLLQQLNNRVRTLTLQKYF